MRGPQHLDAGQFEYRRRARSHRHLPGIEFAPFAAHRHQRQERQAEDLGQRQHVDAIADAARLHQQHTALAAGPGAGQQRHALFFGGQRHRAHRRRAQHPFDQLRMPGIGHVRHLTDIEALQYVKDIFRPGRRGFGRCIGADVHLHFRSVDETVFWAGPSFGRDHRRDSGFRKSENGMSVSTKEYDSMTANARELAADFNLEKLTPEFYADPYPTYRALREHEPVKLLPNGSYFLTRYDDLISAYKNTKLFSSDKKKEFYPKYGASPLYEHHTTSLLFNNTPAPPRPRRLQTG